MSLPPSGEQAEQRPQPEPQTPRLDALARGPERVPARLRKLAPEPVIDAGPRDQRPVQELPQYGLIYRGEVLAEDLTIAGAVRVTLHVQSNCRHTDFVARLIEVEPDGRAMLLMDGVARAMYRNAATEPQHLMPDHVYRLTIHLGDIHYTFRAGNHLQLDVTSSNFPRRARNTKQRRSDPGTRHRSRYLCCHQHCAS